MNTILEGIPRVFCHINDILLWGATTKQNNEALRTALRRLAHVGVTLNEVKCVFYVREPIYLGHKICQEGLRPDEAKIKVITNEIPGEQDRVLKSTRYRYGNIRSLVCSQLGGGVTASHSAPLQETWVIQVYISTNCFRQVEAASHYKSSPRCL